MELKLFDIRDFTPEQYARALSLLSEERQTALRRARDGVARCSAAGEMLARELLAEACGEAPERIRIARHPSGQPYAPELPFHVSISHSGYLAACAIHSAPIGLDLQKLGPVRPPVLRRVYSPEEQRYVLADPAVQEERFARLWCMKEAWGKRLGIGIFTDSRFCCRFYRGEPLPEGDDCRFLFPTPPEGYALAVCL